MTVKIENIRKSITLNPNEINELTFLLSNQKVSFSKLVRRLIHQEYQLCKAGFRTKGLEK